METQPTSKIGPHISGKRAGQVLGITVEEASLTLTKPIMCRHPSRSVYPLEFRVRHLECFVLRIFSFMATIELAMSSYGEQTKPMDYP